MMENSGQILPTTYLYTDPVNNLDYFEADSPSGLSTFGLSSLTGNNNPFRLITFTIANIINPSGGSRNVPPGVVITPNRTPEATSVLPIPAGLPKSMPTHRAFYSGHNVAVN